VAAGWPPDHVRFKEPEVETQSRAERTLTRIDHGRLSRLALMSERDACGLVQAVLDDSDVVASTCVPPSVVTMYTQVLLQGDPGTQPQKITLCYPDDAEPSRGFVSVLSPLGASLLGLSMGDRAQWRSPAGEERSAQIVSVLFQPEASGDYTT
jgi:regulator of nucleoside diphosphate kinase